MDGLPDGQEVSKMSMVSRFLRFLGRVIMKAVNEPEEFKADVGEGIAALDAIWPFIPEGSKPALTKLKVAGQKVIKAVEYAQLMGDQP